MKAKWLIVILALASALQLRSAFLSRPELIINPSTIVPASLPGWAVQNLPLGATESLQSASERILALDDYVYRTYTQNANTIHIYIGFWKAENDLRDAGLGHTPDACWDGTGMKMTHKATTDGLAQASHPLKLGAYRRFVTAGNESIQVLYWHLAGGRPSQFWWLPDKSVSQRCVEAWHGLKSGPQHTDREERVYVRIHSGLEPAAMLESEPVRETFARLANAGVPLAAPERVRGL